MTGHGRGEAPLEGGSLVVEIRTVNQRFVEVRARAPRDFGDLAALAEQLVRERIRRGRVDVSIRRDGEVRPFDVALIRQAVGDVLALRRELGLDAADLPVGALLPIVLERSGACGSEPAAREAVRAATARALDDLEASRAREGGIVARDVAGAGARAQALVAELRAGGAATRARAEARLRERISTLLGGAEGQPPLADAGRVEREIAVLLERSDVTEELNRLSAHLAEVERMLAAPEAHAAPQPIGRRLDFLLQECFREATTLGAKALDVGAAKAALDLRVELERMREQVQNLE